MPTAHQEVQFGVQYLAQGHFSIQLGGAGIQTSAFLIARRLAVLPELQPTPCADGKSGELLYPTNHFWTIYSTGELSSQVTSHTCFSLIFFAADTIGCRLPFHGCTYNSESLASYCQGQLPLTFVHRLLRKKKNRGDTHEPAKMSILHRHKLTNCGRIDRGYFQLIYRP